MSHAPIDYAALAQKFGGKVASSGASPDYAALAAQFGGRPGAPNSAPAPAPANTSIHPLDALANYAHGLFEQVNPVTMAKGVGQMVEHPLDTLRAVGQQDQATLNQAKQAWNAGNHVEAVRHFIDYLTGPVGGNALDQAGNEAQHGQIAHALGTATGVGLTLASPEIVPKVINAAKEGAGAVGDVAASARNSAAGNALLGPNADAIEPVSATVKALRARNSIRNFPDAVKTALPDVRRSLDAQGIDPEQMSVRQFEGAIHNAKAQVWQEYTDNYLTPTANKNIPVNDVASAIKQKVRSLTPMAARENAGAVNAARDLVSDYSGQEMPMARIETRIHELNNELRQAQSTYKMTEQALRNSPSMSYKFAELDALRKVEQNAFDSMQGPGADLLKQRYGALKTLQDVTERRIPVIERANNERLFAGAGKIAGGGNMAMGTIKTVLGKPSEGIPMFAKGAAEWQIGRNIQKMNDPEFLLQSALRNTASREAPAVNITPQYAALPSHGIAMPGNVPTPQPPSFYSDTTAARKGRMLPPASNAIPLPAAFDQVAYDDAAEGRLVRDPRTGRMRKISAAASRKK